MCSKNSLKISDVFFEKLEKKDLFYLKIENSFINKLELKDINKVKFDNSIFSSGNFKNISNFFMIFSSSSYIYRLFFENEYAEPKKLKKFKIFNNIILENIKHIVLTLPLKIANLFFKNLKQIKQIKTFYLKIIFNFNNSIKEVLSLIIRLIDFILDNIKDFSIIIEYEKIKKDIKNIELNSINILMESIKKYLIDYQNSHITYNELKHNLLILYLKNNCLFHKYRLNEPKTFSKYNQTFKKINSI